MATAEVFALDETAGLFELMRLRRAAARAFDPLGFTLYEAMLLLLIEQEIEHPHALTDALGIQRTATSALLTKFVKVGLVRRSAGERDGRYVHVRLTPKGCRAAQQVSEAWAGQKAGAR